MATATTKAQLETALAAAQARIAELEAATQSAEATEGGRRDQLEQTLWLQRKGVNRQGVTGDGTPWVQFGAQYASVGKDGQRTFGAWKDFVAFGDMAETVLEAFGTDNRLARIGAYERPWHGKPDASGYPTRNTEWCVVQFSLVGRVTPPAPAPTPAAAPTPQLAGVSF